MIQPVVAASIVVVAGAVVAVAARDNRLVSLGLLVAMVAATFVSSPLPTSAVLAFRILGALLAAYLLWASAHARSIKSEGTGIGITAELAAAAAAFAVGWFMTAVRPLPGPVAAQAAGIALAALVVVPLTGRNVLRLGIGATLLVIAVSLLREAWLGPASTPEHAVTAALLVGVAGATSLLMSPIEERATQRAAAGAKAQAAESTPARDVSTPGGQPVAEAGAASAAAPAAVAEATAAPPAVADSIAATPPAAAAPVPSRARRIRVREPRP